MNDYTSVFSVCQARKIPAGVLSITSCRLKKKEKYWFALEQYLISYL